MFQNSTSVKWTVFLPLFLETRKTFPRETGIPTCLIGYGGTSSSGYAVSKNGPVQLQLPTAQNVEAEFQLGFSGLQMNWTYLLKQSNFFN